MSNILDVLIYNCISGNCFSYISATMVLLWCYSCHHKLYTPCSHIFSLLSLMLYWQSLSRAFNDLLINAVNVIPIYRMLFHVGIKWQPQSTDENRIWNLNLLIYSAQLTLIENIRIVGNIIKYFIKYLPNSYICCLLVLKYFTFSSAFIVSCTDVYIFLPR